MQYIQVLWQALAILVAAATAATAEEWSWRGIAVEARTGYQSTTLSFGADNGTDAVMLSVDDGVAIVGAKLSYRIALGDRWRFGPTMAYYGRGHEDTTSGASVDYDVAGAISYADVQSATVGLQLGRVISSRVYVYGEAGYAGQHSRGAITLTSGGTTVAGTGEGYLVGDYVAIGAVYAVSGHTAFTVEWQEVAYDGTYTDAGSGASIGIKQQRVNLGVEFRW